MLIPQIVLMALVIFHGVSAKINFEVKTYKWNEEIQRCSYSLSILTDVICTYDNEMAMPNIGRPKRSTKKRLSLNIECCKNKCTPLHILTKYCDHPERMDITKDLHIYTVMSFDSSVTTTNAPTTTSHSLLSGTSTMGAFFAKGLTTHDPRNIILTRKLMLCYMHLVQFCPEGINKQIDDLMGTMGFIVQE